MARGQYIEIPMVVDSVVVGLITMRQDMVDRFDIPSEVVSFELPGINRKRKAHERRVYLNANDATPQPINSKVKDVIFVYRPEKNRINSGKKIKLDTGLRSKPPSLTGAAADDPNAGSVRYATANFPHGASNYQIARWLTINIPENRRPNHFVTPSGARRRTAVAAAPGQTAGEVSEETTP